MKLPLIAVFAVSLVASGCTLSGSRGKLANSGSLAPNQPYQALAFAADKSFEKGLSKADRAVLSAAEKQALDYGVAGKAVDWKSEEPGVSGKVLAWQPFRVGQSNCRRFKHTLVVQTKPRNTQGTACKRADGVWKLVE